MTRMFALFALGSLLALPAFAGKPHAERHAWTMELPFGEQMGPFARGARLGVGVTPLTEDLRVHFGASADEGVLVSKVFEDTAAARAGLEAGDVIVSVGERRISNGMVLRSAVAENAGTSVEIEVIRNGRVRTLKADLPEGAMPTEQVRRFEFPGGEGRVIVIGGDDGEVEVDVEAIQREVLDHLDELPFHGGPGVGPAELDELYQRLDDLEQRLIEMSDRLDQSADKFEERIQSLDR